MKKAGLGALIGAGLIVAALGGFGQRSDVFAQRMQPVLSPGSDGELLVVPISSGDKGQLLAVIEPRLRVMSVYRIDPLSGKIALKSVRNFTWDLQMTYLNNEAPLPQEIKSMLVQ
jgi:hypothetical protein